MRKLIFSLIILLMSTSVFSQNTKTALIIIDIQEFYFPGGKSELTDPELAAQNAQKLLQSFREKNMFVIHVKHNFEPGGNIHQLVKPLPSEKVIVKDEVNCFKNTDLEQYLRENKITDLVLCGMQTHMCLEGGTRAGSDLGFTCTVIDDACATRNLKFGDKIIKAHDVHYATLSTLQSYAKVMDTNTFLKTFK